MITIDGLRLWGARESTNASEARLDVTSIPSQGSEETLVVGLESAETQPLSGRATGIRLTGQSGYSSDPETALSEWVQEFESLVIAEQGDGWALADDERDRSIDGIVTEASWTMAHGAPYEVRWSLSFDRGQGVLNDASRAPTTATPNATTTLGGTDLGTITERRMERTIDIGVTPIAFADESETILTPQSGVTRRVTIAGRVTGSAASLRTIDDTMRGYVGDNTTRAYQTGFPGTSHDVLVDSYDSTHNAGSPALLTYAMTLFEGVAL